MFIGRDAELSYLEQFYEKEGSQILVLYGEKGIGKTELLKKFTEKKDVTFYTAGAVFDREQQREWAAELNLSGVQISEYPDYEEIFKTVFPDHTGKTVLVVEQFQYLVRGNNDFFESLVSFLDKRRMSRPVFVLLSSSALGWVENGMNSELGSYAAFIDGRLKINELSFQYIKMLHPKLSAMDCLYTYAFLGGNPGFWNWFDVCGSFKDNMEQVLEKKCRLYSEMEYYFADGLREPAVYNTILTNVAGGFCKLNDIYDRTGYSRAKISVYLKNLMELGLIEKIYAGVYRVASPLLEFYFKFLFPHRSLLEILPAEEFYGRIIEGRMGEFSREAYAKACRQAYEAQNPDGFEVFDWKDKAGSLDIVTVDAQNRRVAGICVLQEEFDKTSYKKLVSLLRHAKIQPDRLLLYSEAEETEDLKKLVKKGKIEHCSLGLRS